MNRPAWRLEVHAGLCSTQRLAALRAADGAPHRSAVLALEQAAGQGRGGRAWISAAGNLHLTALLRPAAPARQVGELALVAAVALHDAAIAHAPARLKWPNDLMLGGAKVGGVLTEARLEGSRMAWLLFGFGVNLETAPVVAGRDTARLGPVPPETFARALLARLDDWLDRHAEQGFAPVRAAWMRAGPPLGTLLTVRQGDSALTGRYEGLDDDGALRIATPGGPRRVVTGELERG